MKKHPRAVKIIILWDGYRIGFEPEWSMEQAVENLQWNRNTYPEKKVEGRFNGKKCPDPFSKLLIT